MELIAITEEYYEFVREMRMHPENVAAFSEIANITPEDQIEYMEKHGDNYFVALLYGEPVGYVGVIDNDIRICTHPDHQGRGIGRFMLSEIIKLYPQATGKILKDNIASKKLFDFCGVQYTIL
jgi:GNAT superfamily N-acetyltransferase